MLYRKIALLIIISFCMVPALSAVEWHEMKGDHFRVYYLNNEEFAKDILKKAEVYYNRIASELGYPRYSEFWTWEKRVKIYIYPDHKAYLSSTSSPSWSHGLANYKNKQIISYEWGEGFVDSILPHEIAHLIFRDFVGFKGDIPLWLDEGVAQWAEEPKRQAVKQVIRQQYDNDSLICLEDMLSLDISKVEVDKSIHVRTTTRTRTGDRTVVFITGESIINMFYVQAVSIIGFLIEKYGANDFTVFCRELRDGKKLNDALRSAYPFHINNVDDLEREWVKYLGETYK